MGVERTWATSLLGIVVVLTACSSQSATGDTHHHRDAAPRDAGGEDAPAMDQRSEGPQSRDKAPPACGTPTFSPAPGVHDYYTEITVACAGATVHYTLDGTPPTPASKVLGGGLRLTSRLAGRPIRVIAVQDGVASPEASATYTLEPGVILHFKKPSAWTAAHLHYWDAVPSGQSTTWPGSPMKAEAGGWYFHHFKGQTAVKVVFNGNTSPQSGDISVDIAEAWVDERGDLWDMDPELLRHIAWPGGKYKAAVLSFDDGNVQDRPFVALLDKYGLVGSFNLNSGRLGTPTYIAASEVATLFAGHEVATHSVSHPYLTSLSEAQIKAELVNDRAALEALVPYSVRGHAYPFGDTNDTVLKVMKQVGLVYGRVVPQTKDLRLPSQLLLWRGSCHHTCAYPLVQDLIAWNKKEMALLQIWGHSWELDGGGPGADWAYMESLLELLGNKTDIWYAKAIEVADYLLALRKLEWSTELESVKNASTISIWVKNTTGDAVELKPGAVGVLP